MSRLVLQCLSMFAIELLLASNEDKLAVQNRSMADHLILAGKYLYLIRSSNFKLHDLMEVVIDDFIEWRSARCSHGCLLMVNLKIFTCDMFLMKIIPTMPFTLNETELQFV